MVKVLGKEIVRYALDAAASSASTANIYVVSNENSGEDLVRLLADAYPSVTVVDIGSHQTRGAAETVLLGLADADINAAETPLLILDGDSFYTCDIAAMMAEEAAQATAAVTYVLDNGPLPQYSYVKVNTATGACTAIAEKKKISDCANTGAYYFSSCAAYCDAARAVLAATSPTGPEIYISAVLHAMLLAGESVRAIRLAAEDHISLGTPALVTAYEARTAAFLFDLDGTLVNTDAVYMKVWRELLAPYNIDVTTDFYMTHIHGNHDSNVCEMLFGSQSRETDCATATAAQLSERKDTLFAAYISEVTEIPGAVAFVRAVKRAGHKIAVVTNSNRRTAEAVLAQLGLVVDVLCIGSECAAPKPSPEPYLQAMAAFRGAGSSKLRTYIFEDSKSGLLSAMNAAYAAPTCIIGVEGSQRRAELEQQGADIVIEDYEAGSGSNLLERLLSWMPAATRRGSSFSTAKGEDLVDCILQTVAKTHPGVTAVTIDPKCLKGGYINDVIRCTLQTAAGEEIPCICKLENKRENGLSDMANAIQLYDREYLFYENIYPYVEVKVPTYMGTIRDADLNRIGILMREVVGAELSPDANTMRLGELLGIVDDLVSLHVRFAGKGLCEKFKGLHTAAGAPYADFMAAFVRANVGCFVEKWRFMITEADIQMVVRAAEDYPRWAEQLSAGLLTLCHGDFKTPNMFYRRPEGEMILMDWQYVSEGKGVQDLVFFMIESLTPERFAELYPMLAGYYYERLREGLGSALAYKRAEYAADLEAALFYFPLFVAIWFGVTDPEHLLDKNFPFFFIKRFLAAARVMVGSGSV
jgi:beta-phosphoglucomutase-like phosphatase (HAD superfamily)/choline kinase/aminoglycoside phosphotransferase (APT) family kinase protein